MISYLFKMEFIWLIAAFRFKLNFWILILLKAEKMSDENSISEDEKIKIAANFLFHSPPGEFKEVFLDLRGLLNDDRILKKSLNK